MVLKEIPGYNPYAISSDGSILKNLDTGYIKSTYILTHKGNRSKYRYTDIRNKSVGIHRLVGLAWIHNDSPDTKIYINHIDGDGLNNDISNLEWCTPQENSISSLTQGRRLDVIGCRCRHWKTGEIKEFPSVSRMCHFLGIENNQSSSSVFPKMFGKLVAGEWETRQVGDDRPWVYETWDLSRGKFISRYKINVTHPDKTTSFYYSLDDLFKTLSAPRFLISKSVPFVCEYLSGLYPDYIIDYIDSYNYNWRHNSVNRAKPEKGIVIAYNGKNLLVFDSIRSAARAYNVSRSVISGRLDKDIPYDEWYFFRNNKPNIKVT